MSGVEQRIVAPEDEDVRVDKWFHRHFPALGFGRLQKLLRTGQIRVDGRRAKAGQRLAKGQTIRVPPLGEASAPTTARPERPAPDAEDSRFLESRILYRDDHVIALDKPSGLPVQGGSKVTRNLDALLEAIADPTHGRPRLVHRLDRDTSGVIVVGRTPSAAASLAEAFKGRDAKKLYWTILVGAPSPRQGRVDLAVAKREGRAGEKMTVVGPGDDEGDGLAARTRYAVINHASAETGRGLAWVSFLPETGRTHQIRVHAAALGTPILGDGKYGGRRAFPPIAGQTERPLLHLHARRLIVPHPTVGVLDLSAPLPNHMLESFRRLGFDPDSDGDPFGLGPVQKTSGTRK